MMNNRSKEELEKNSSFNSEISQSLPVCKKGGWQLCPALVISLLPGLHTLGNKETNNSNS